MWRSILTFERLLRRKEILKTVNILLCAVRLVPQLRAAALGGVFFPYLWMLYQLNKLKWAIGFILEKVRNDAKSKLQAWSVCHIQGAWNYEVFLSRMLSFVLPNSVKAKMQIQFRFLFPVYNRVIWPKWQYTKNNCLGFACPQSSFAYHSNY